MPTGEGILEAISDAKLVAQAAEHYQSVDAFQGRLLAKLRRMHHYYAPPRGDQWPEDLTQRPGKLHMTSNYCKPVVDVDARLQAKLPRISQEPNGTDEDDLKDAEAAEKVMQRFLELSSWQLWMGDFTRTKCTYGFGVLRVFWNKKENRPDVVVVENPGNLRIGWGTSDYREMDWAIYSYGISPIEAMRRFPDLIITPQKDREPYVIKRGGTHDDPLAQMTPVPTSRPQLLDRPTDHMPSEYEGRQVSCWNYWFKDTTGGVWEAFIVGGQLAGKPKRHPELPDIPYIIVENDHEPGVPWGIATHETIIDLQIELNRALSHAAQITNDELDPAWVMEGDNADSVPDGLVPRGGEILAAGTGNKIVPLQKTVNFAPLMQFISEVKEQMHDLTGLPRILFGQSPGSQTTGRALSVQVEAAINRLDPKRERLYQGLRELLLFWGFMVEKRNPGGIGSLVKGFRRWKIVAPEITPRDVLEMTTNVQNQIQAKIISLKTARDMLGYDSPVDEEALIIAERNNIDLFPGDVQVKIAGLLQLLSLQMQQQQMQQQPGIEQAGDEAQGALANLEQQAQPSLGQHMNDGAAQPATQVGSPAPAGGPAPGGPVGTTLIRPQASGQAQALNQIAVQRRL